MPATTPTARACCSTSAGPTRRRPGDRAGAGARSQGRRGARPAGGDRGGPEPARGGAHGRPAGGRAEPGLRAAADRALLRAAGELRSRGGARDAARGGPSARPRMRSPGRGSPRSSCSFGNLKAAQAAAERAVALAPDLEPHPDGARLRGAHPDRHRPGQGGVRAGDRAGLRRAARRASASASPRSARAISTRAGGRSRSRSPSIPTTRCSAATSARRTSRSGATRSTASSTRSPSSSIRTTRRPGSTTRSACRPINRPVEALHDIEKSIELNDNRAVYRSRLLLDRGSRGARHQPRADLRRPRFPGARCQRGDEVARGRSGQLRRHRFLSDIADVGVRRREIARVSELLQAQLLQQININPVQPSLSEANFEPRDPRRPRAGRASTSSRRCSSAIRRS